MFFQKGSPPRTSCFGCRRIFSNTLEDLLEIFLSECTKLTRHRFNMGFDKDSAFDVAVVVSRSYFWGKKKGFSRRNYLLVDAINIFNFVVAIFFA